MPRRLPRCVFGREAGYQCTEAGIGNPPLCGYHFDLLNRAEYEDDRGDLLEAAVNMFVDHPSIQSVLERFVDFLQEVGAQIPPNDIPRGHPAEAPPPPPGGRRRRAKRPASPPPPPRDDPRTILHFGSQEPLTRDAIKRRQRQLAEIFHPDRGGSVEAMQKINAAAEALLSQLR